MSSRLDKLLKDEEFLHTLNTAFDDFEEKNSNADANKFFASLLNYSTVNQFLNNFQTSNNKYFKIDELLIILDSLGSSRKIILDYICNRYELLCVESVHCDIKSDNFEKIFFEISLLTGEIAELYKEFNKDNKLDNQEKEQLNKLLYKFRTMICSFQFEELE